MAKFPVFISHSTDAKNAADLARLAAIVDGLGAGDDGFDVMWDHGEITSADDWRARIHIMLAECRAAIILFSERALTQSEWVLKEATILCHRRARDPLFRVLPIIMPDATESHLTKGAWQPLAFKTIQYQRETAADIAGLVATARAGIDPAARTRTPLDELAIGIAAFLEQTPASGLRNASEKHLERRDWEGAPSVQLGFAMGLARLLLQSSSLVEAVRVLDDAHGIPPDAVLGICRVVAPLWVDAEAAAPLRAGVFQGLPHYDVGLNGLRLGPYTANSYVLRAYPDSTLPILNVILDCNAGDVVTHIAQSLRSDVRKSIEELATLNDRDVDAHLNSDGVLRFVFVPALLNEAELKRLRDLYSRPVFIFGTGPSLPRTAEPSGVRFLRPELDTEREKLAFQEWLDAKTNVVNRRKRVGGG